MRRFRPWFGGLFIIMLLAGTHGRAASSQEVLLVIPARYRLLQLAFDVLSLRHFTLVAYQYAPKTGEIVLDKWNERSRQWERVPMATYIGGRLAPTREIAAVIVCDDALVMNQLKEATTGWAEVVVPVATLDLQTIVNTMDEGFAFSSREWDWLAGRYGLKVADLNAERRRYGRFGRPGERPKIPEGKRNPLLEWWDEIRGRSSPPPAVPMPPPAAGSGSAAPAVSVPVIETAPKKGTEAPKITTGEEISVPAASSAVPSPSVPKRRLPEDK